MSFIINILILNNKTKINCSIFYLNLLQLFILLFSFNSIIMYYINELNHLISTRYKRL
jgi:hypothetical protein